MALSNYTYFEVRTTGSDTTNSGGFDVNSSGFITNGSITSANTASPVISSASYAFVAGDVGSWVFIKSGTNSIPGWYRIVSVTSGAATLNGTIGQAFVATALQISTSLGCGSSATLSSITFGIDYSQQDSYKYTGTFIVQTNTSNIVGSGITIDRNWVGNIINLVDGTVNAGYYNILSVSAGVATLDRAVGIAAATSTGYVGGAFASPGKAQSIKVQSNKTYIKSGTYLFTTTTRNVSMGALTNVGGSANASGVGFERIEGYGSVRGDKLNPPIFKAGIAFTGTSFFGTLYTNINIENIVFDGSGNSGVIGIQDLQNPSRGLMIHKCKFTNLVAPTTGILVGVISYSEFSFNSGQCIYCREGLKVVNCFFHDNTATCISVDDGTVINSIFANNTGGSTSGIAMGDTPGTISNCTFYKNGYSGIIIGVNGGRHNTLVQNCLFVNNVTTGLYANTNIPTLLNNAFYTTTGSNHTFIGNTSSFVILSGNPLVDPDNGNFNLNSVAGAGLLARSAFVAPFVLDSNTINYTDPGAAQSIDSVSYLNPEISILVRAGITSRTEFLYLNTTGMAFNSAGLSASYVRPGSARVGITLVTQTISGSWTSGGFVEVDSVTMPGLYRLDVPNAIFASGVNSAAIEIFNSNTNDRFVVTYHFTQEMQLDLAQPIPNSTNVGSIGEALNAMRAQGFGKWAFDGTNLSMYAADNVTILKTLTFNSVSNPTMRS